MSEAGRFVIVGAGKQADKHLAGIRAAAPGAALRVVDADPAAARRFGERYAIPWSDDLEGVLGQEASDAVLIATPTPSHAPLARLALDAGAHVFCEKPLTWHAAEAAGLAELAAAKGRHAMVGHVYRFVPAFARARELLAGLEATGTSTALDRVFAVQMRLGGRGGHALWKHKRATGGGAINEMMAHLVDLADWLLGEIAHVECWSAALRRPVRPVGGETVEVDAEDDVWVRLVSRSGVEAVLQADLITPAFANRVEVQGENGSLMASIQAEMPSFVHLLEPRAGLAAGRTALPVMETGPFEAQMAEFVGLVQGRIKEPRSGFADAARVMALLERIREAAEARLA